MTELSPEQRKSLVENALSGIERVEQIRDNASKDYMDSRRTDIDHLRGLIVQTSIISFGAVGFSVPILEKQDIIKHPEFYALSLFLLTCAAILGLWYSAVITENSLIDGFKKFKNLRLDINRAISLLRNIARSPDNLVLMQQELVEYDQNMQNQIDEYDQEVLHRSLFLYLILALLSLGIIFLFPSVF